MFGSEPPAGVQCRSRARAVRSPSVTRLFYCSLAPLIHLPRPPLAAPVFSRRSLSWISEIHPLSFAAGMTTRVGVERFADPLPRAAECAARRLSTVTFIAHLHSHIREPIFPFAPVCLPSTYLKTQLGKVITSIIMEHRFLNSQVDKKNDY